MRDEAQKKLDEICDFTNSAIVQFGPFDADTLFSKYSDYYISEGIKNVDLLLQILNKLLTTDRIFKNSSDLYYANPASGLNISYIEANKQEKNKKRLKDTVDIILRVLPIICSIFFGITTILFNVRNYDLNNKVNNQNITIKNLNITIKGQQEIIDSLEKETTTAKK